MSSELKASYTIELDRCLHGVETITLMCSSGGGIRIAGPKCCGRSTMVKSWPMGAALLRMAADEFGNAASQVEELES